MVGDLRQPSALLKSSNSNKSCIQQINNSRRSPEADEQGNNNNLVDVNIRVGDNQACGCGSLAAGTLKDPESADSQHKERTVAMHRGLFPESSKNQDHRIVQSNTSADSASGNNSDLDPSRDSSTSSSIAPSFVSGTNKHDGFVNNFGDLTQPSLAAINVTVPRPSAENSEQSKENTESDQELKSRLTSSRQTWALPSSGSQDKSTMPTLDENQELHVPSSVRAGIVPLPQMSNRISQAAMGRRHSMDSNIGRSRPPTFVRTYREVKWKRVSKPPKLRQLPRTSSTGNVAAAAVADSGGDDESESREYITGTHIIRQRVPIFMTSGDPPDPMGRRFSAGDLIPLTGPGQHWAPNGKCLVIRDMVPSKLADTSSSDDSGSSSSAPSSSEDVRSTHSSGSRHSNVDRDDHCDFSLIDEDDEDNEDSSEDGSDDDEDGNLPSKTTDDESTLGPSPNSSTSPPVTDNLSTLSKKSDVQKPFDLRRLALENSLQQKTISLHQTTVSSPETLPQTTIESPGSLPTLLQPSAVTNNQPVLVQASIVSKDTFMPTTAHVQSTLSMSPTSATTSAAASQPDLLPATLQLPLIPISPQLATISASLHSKLVSEADAGARISALSLSSGIVPQFPMPSATSQNILTVRDQTPVIPSTPHPATIPVTLSSPAMADGKPSTVAIPTEDTHDVAINDNELHPKLSHETDAQQSTASRPSVPRPASPYEMPWVLTSTKIADANVYVSSSCSPDSHTSIRSAHWISPRNVEGTIPINLDDARAIRVETVSVPTTSGDETLQFQKVSYSSGFIISSAQWVAPTEVKESTSSNGLKSVPTGTLLAQESDAPDPTSVPEQKVPAVTGTTPPSASKKIRKKYVPRSTGFNQQPTPGISEGPSSSKLAPQFRRPKQRIPVVCDQKVSTVPRKLKRNLIVETAIRDPLQMLESELCTKLSSPSMGRSTSPAITKRRFIVQKVPYDSLSSNHAAVKNLSPVFNLVSTPMHRARGFVLKDLKESAFKSRAERKESSSPLSASSQESERVSQFVVSQEKDSFNATLPLDTSVQKVEDNAHSIATSTVSETETTADSARPRNAVGESGLTVESIQVTNALGKLELAAESVQPQNELSRSELAAESKQVNYARSETGSAAENARRSSAVSEIEPAADELQLSSAVSRLESAAELVACSNVVRKQEPVANCAPTTDSGHSVVTDNTQPSITTDQKPLVETSQSTTPLIELETVPLTSTLTKESSVEVANSTQSETSHPGNALDDEREPLREAVLPLMCERSEASSGASLRSQPSQRVSDTLQGIQMATDVSIQPSMSAASTQIPGFTGCEHGVLSENASSQARRARLRTDTDDDELFAKENDALLQIILSTLSDSKELAGLDTNLCGGSTVAIDNKIEQAMDLVKRHLMYAVREEVEILKQQIGEMMERIGQLEYENSILRSEAKPETLSKLQQPRLPPQPTQQAVLPSQPQPQPASVLLTPAPLHPSVPQVQPPQQQPTAVSQVGQPPSTT